MTTARPMMAGWPGGRGKPKDNRPAKRGKNEGRQEQMKNITREGDANKYYMYKGTFITRDRRTGYYSAYTSRGRLMADTQRGIKKLINENAVCAKQ